MKRRFTLVTADEPIPQTEDDIKAQLSIFDRVLNADDIDVLADDDVDGTHIQDQFFFKFFVKQFS